MKRGAIIKPNRKGQIVIPKEMRKSLGILADTHLHLLQRGHGIYVNPVKEVTGESFHETSYPALLKETKGKWGEESDQIRIKRRKRELLASAKRKVSW